MFLLPVVFGNYKRDKINEVLQYIESRLEELQGEKEELTEYQRLDRRRRALEYTLYDKELRKVRSTIAVKQFIALIHTNNAPDAHASIGS